jgi:hypothetical protein
MAMLRTVPPANMDADAPDCLDTKGVAIRDRMNRYRALYDEPYSNKYTRMHFRQAALDFEHCGVALNKLMAKATGDPVSNAYLKCFELLNILDIRPQVHFDNASLPGGWILATARHATMNGRRAPAWRASSLVAHGALEDHYHLMKGKLRNRWLMLPGNGDVCDPAVIEHIATRMARERIGRVDFYTSDLGFDVSADYNNQETLHMRANLGQVILGLRLLAVGPASTFITKQYTMCEPFTISLMAVLSRVFGRLDIIKPFTSKAANQEMYVVGRGVPDAAALDEALRVCRAARPPEPLCRYDADFEAYILAIQSELGDRLVGRICRIMVHYGSPGDPLNGNVRAATKKQSELWMAANWRPS